MRTSLILLAAVVLTGCSTQRPKTDFGALTKDFVESSLALSPVAATAAGYHEHRGAKLDTLLDDYTAAGVEKQRAHWREWDQRLKDVAPGTLDPGQQADLDLMRTQIALAQFELEKARGWRRNPTLYVELAGNALFAPFSLQYAPPETRFGHIIARLNALPAFAEAAAANLESAPPVWKRVAREENAGTIALIDVAVRAEAPAALKADYDAAAAKAIAALRTFDAKIAALRDEGEDAWRMGEALYAEKFRLVMGSTRTPAESLAEAESDLTAIRRKMWELSLPLHVKLYPTHKDPVDLNLIVGEVLTKIAARHATRENYFKAAASTLEEAREFLKANQAKLVSPPPNDNLKIIETPPFMRGIYGVGGFNPAPALEPKLGAFYWVTPIPKSWPAARVESKLREYNDFGLRLLTIHETVPGHWVQAEYAAAIEPPGRRLLRAVFGSGVYVEGWAVYVTEKMLEAGLAGNPPEMQLTFLKQLLRSVANAILDVRLHTKGMTRDEALALMTQKTFQEREEAEAKWQRAQLSSCQLPTYYAGYKEWLRLRAASEKGTKASAQVFHERALREGALPMRSLASLLGLEEKAAAAK